MAYLKNKLISRVGYGGVGGWTDTVGDLLKGTLNVIGAQQRAVGAQEALQAQLQQQQAAASLSTGPDTTTLLLGLGAVGVVGYLLLRKKKSAA